MQKLTMLKLIEKIPGAAQSTLSLTLPWHLRIKSRQRVVLDDGGEAGIFLPRGETLRDGDCLLAEDGQQVRVHAALETLSTVQSDDPHLLARACYHLGNRHVTVQILPDRVSYQHDHVLDDMLRGFGMQVETIQAPFEPEPGAYGGSADRTHHHHHRHEH